MSTITTIESVKKPRIIISFFRAQVTALAATAVDFSVMIFFKEILGLWYMVAVVIGTSAGGFVGFMLGRYWAFISTEVKSIKQAKKYLAVMVGSFLLNVGGVYLMVEDLHFQYIIAKVIVAIVVGIGFNFFLQRYFVFK
jgi:putative flippase GtrA